MSRPIGREAAGAKGRRAAQVVHEPRKLRQWRWQHNRRGVATSVRAEGARRADELPVDVPEDFGGRVARIEAVQGAADQQRGCGSLIEATEELWRGRCARHPR